MELRLVLVVLFLSSGRSGEIAKAKFATMRWNLDKGWVECIWNCIKTNAQQSGMIYLPELLTYLLDFANAMFDYHVVGGPSNRPMLVRDSERDDCWLIPAFLQLSGSSGVSNKLSKKLKSFVG